MNARKIAPNPTYLAFGDALWGLPSYVVHFIKPFSLAKFASHIVCFYLEPFRSLALKLTILEKYSNVKHIWPFWRSYMGLASQTIHFRKLFSRQQSLMSLSRTVKKLRSLRELTM